MRSNARPPPPSALPCNATPSPFHASRRDARTGRPHRPHTPNRGRPHRPHWPHRGSQATPGQRGGRPHRPHRGSQATPGQRGGRPHRPHRGLHCFAMQKGGGSPPKPDPKGVPCIRPAERRTPVRPTGCKDGQGPEGAPTPFCIALQCNPKPVSLNGPCIALQCNPKPVPSDGPILRLSH